MMGIRHKLSPNWGSIGGNADRPAAGISRVTAVKLYDVFNTWMGARPQESNFIIARTDFRLHPALQTTLLRNEANSDVATSCAPVERVAPLTTFSDGFFRLFPVLFPVSREYAPRRTASLDVVHYCATNATFAGACYGKDD